MHWLRRYGRLLRLALHILHGMLLTVWLSGLMRMNFNMPFYQRVTQWWLRQITRILGVHVKVYGEPAPAPVLMVANHISWLDIALLGGYSQPRFLSKQEVRAWPVVGWLAATSGTLFITRGKAGAAAQAATTIGEALQAGRTVLLFPEGTTTTGNDVRTFHARLFAPALEAGIAVQPVALRYPTQNGLTHPLIPYVDQQSLWDNLQGILGEPRLSAEIHFLPVLQTAGADRKTIAAACEQQIRSIVRHT